VAVGPLRQCYPVVLRQQHFAYPSAMFNRWPQGPERVEYPGVPIYSRVTEPRQLFAGG